MDPTSLILLAGGGLLAVKASQQNEASATTKSTTVSTKKASLQRAFGVTPKAIKGSTGLKDPYVVPAQRGAPASSKASGSQSVVDAMEAKAMEKWNALTADAKKIACEKMKAEFPNSPQVQALDCSGSSYKQVAQALAAGAAAAGCASTGIGAAASGLCGVVGGKVGGYIYENADEWASDAWDSVSDAASDAWDSTIGSLY